MTIRVTVKNEQTEGKTAFTTLVDPATQQPYGPSRPLAPGETHEYYVHKQAKLEVHEPLED